MRRFHTWYQRLTSHLLLAYLAEEGGSKRLHHMLVRRDEAVSDQRTTDFAMRISGLPSPLASGITPTMT
jgi:hypothetical protein